MLVLDRRRNEEIFIFDETTGEHIRLVVTETDHRRTRLGFEAPQRFRIQRREVVDSMISRGELTPELTKPVAA